MRIRETWMDKCKKDKPMKRDTGSIRESRIGNKGKGLEVADKCFC